jgi:hypothetical protein
VGVDGVQPLVELAEAVRVVAMLGLVQQPRPLGVGGEHGLERCGLPGRRFLRDIAQTSAARHGDVAAVRLQHVAITRTKVVLPAPLRPISPMRPRGGSAAVAPSMMVRPPRRTVMPLMLSMAAPLAAAEPEPKPHGGQPSAAPGGE